MKCNYINIKVKEKKCKILELFKLSLGNNANSLYYNEKEKKCPNINLKLIYYKKYIEKNIGKIIYTKYGFYSKIFNKKFLLKNKKRAKIIINNKQYNLKENIENEKQIFKIKIKFLDIIIYLNSMFRDCESLSYVYNFKNLNTKYIKTIYDLFCGCNLLLYIDDISNWNINNINDISKIFYQCSSLKSLPNISKWNISNVNNISRLFSNCSSLKELPDI